jgi:hypothetical protein
MLMKNFTRLKMQTENFTETKKCDFTTLKSLLIKLVCVWQNKPLFQADHNLYLSKQTKT